MAEVQSVVQWRTTSLLSQTSMKAGAACNSSIYLTRSACPLGFQHPFEFRACAETFQCNNSMVFQFQVQKLQIHHHLAARGCSGQDPIVRVQAVYKPSSALSPSIMYCVDRIECDEECIQMI